MSESKGTKSAQRNGSSISRKFPAYRKSRFISIQGWLRGKQEDDEAEGLWRIGDTIYDFSDFVTRHPGGSFWLAQTKGTDITEPFESHHISKFPEELLYKFKVRQAANPRNYTLTLHENGFYKTLKARVREKLRELDYSPCKRSDLIHLGLLLATFVLALASALTHSIILEALTALAICWLAIVAHNYFHQRDNWQMYTFNFTLMNFSTWRISHALSHHVYPNSLHDLEMSLFEPFLCWIPNADYASKVHRMISVITQPLFYAVIFSFHFVSRAVVSIVHSNVMHWHDGLGFILPIFMWSLSAAPLLYVIRQWLFILSMSSFMFGVIGLNAAHHDPQIHHDGDANREDRDWGLFQVDTIIDRGDIKGSQFMVLTHFGDHVLHHLFPTLDHGVLPQLYPILYETLNEFKVKLRECNHLEHIIGQNKQLLRTEPNRIPPGSARSP